MYIDPVAAVPVFDTATLRQAFRETIARGNPIVTSPTRDNYPEPVVLKPAGVKSWRAFARDASTWDIVEKDGAYQIRGNQRHPQGGGWVPDPEQVITLPPGSGVDDACDRMIAILQAKANE